MSPSPFDLTTITAVNLWLGIPNNVSSPVLQPLITATSRVIYAYLSRPSLLPRSLTERYDGQNNQRMFLKNWPVLSITAVSINGVVIQPSTLPSANNPATVGWLLDPWDGTPPGNVQPLDFVWGVWCRGSQNVSVTYQAGYAIQAEAWTIPTGAPPVIAPFAPYGPWGSDLGVTLANGTPLTLVTGTPVTGQYAQAAGVYTFAVADIGNGVLISYGYIPQNISEACTELVGERFRYMSRIGERSKSLGGQETMAYSLSGLPDWCKVALQPYVANFVPQ